MKRSILTIGTILAFATGTILITSCGTTGNHDDDSGENAELHEEAGHDNDAGGRIRVWLHCPGLYGHFSAATP